ncbi:Extracellular ligand-binding receptor [Artemisia annua]|uniref:Glutamate receptor n=1 Tax=Artemisia annua TaxID=35608 RepID=A0A2U1NEM5_ARTAN|nr:Extracellular ligand-binding receptor [Artemisia annua]
MEIISRKRTDVLFLILMLFCFQIPIKAQDDSSYKEIPVGVILDMGSWVGKTVHSCITMALSDFYTVNNRYKTRIVLHSRDTHGEPLHALSAASNLAEDVNTLFKMHHCQVLFHRTCVYKSTVFQCRGSTASIVQSWSKALDLLEKPTVQAIIGSESTIEAKFLAVLGDEARVPILSLSAAPSSNKYPYFLQITQDEATQFKAIAALAESFKWKNVILICEDAANEIEMAKFLTNTLQEKNIFVTYMSLISTFASNGLVHEELHKLSAMQTNKYIMHTSHSVASHVLIKAKYLGLMDAGYKWLITSKTMDFLNFMDGEVIETMQGVVGFKSYIPQSMDLHKFTLKWRKEHHAMNSLMELKKLNSYGIWAYDAVSALAMAIERTQAEPVLKTNIKEWETSLLDQILRISFRGLGGTFQLFNGRISANVIEIINVIGKEKRRVGFWTKDVGLTKKIGKLNSFPDIIWPGGISTRPTHRMLQMSRKTLRIGIPVRRGRVFQVSYDDQTNSTVVSGFCAEVFRAAFNALAHDVAFEFIPYMKKAEVGKVNYNDLIDRVHDGEFDAAIGDITITANRSKYVDFTLPFTDVGLATLSRNADTNIWIFMQPLSSDLWVVSACFFILMGFVIWILEHHVNEEFQGSAGQQIGTTLCYKNVQAFPKGSPLAPEMSIQIAKLREDGTLKLLEDKWFKKQSDSLPSPKILNLEGFGGLFLISGVSMASALFLFMLYFIHEKVNFTYSMLGGGKLAFIMRFLVPKFAIAV